MAAAVMRMGGGMKLLWVRKRKLDGLHRIGPLRVGVGGCFNSHHICIVLGFFLFLLLLDGDSS